MRSHELRGPACAHGACLGVVHYELHLLYRMIEPVLGPYRSFIVRIACSRHTREIVVDEEGIVRPGEVDISRIPRGDYRLVQIHRFGDRQPETLRTVKRHQAVTCSHQTVDPSAIYGAVDYGDRQALASGHDGRHLPRPFLGVADLYD